MGATVMWCAGQRAWSLTLRAAAVVLVYLLYSRREAASSSPVNSRRPLRRYSYVAHGARPRRPLSQTQPTNVDAASPSTPATTNVPNSVNTTAVLPCARCGALKKHGGAVDLNCCSRGGTWVGQCGPPGSGAPFTWKAGFRACNQVSVAPAPRRAQHGAFVPLLPAMDATHHSHSPNSTAAEQLSTMRAYVLTLGALGPAEARLQRMLDSAHSLHPGAIRGTALAAVRRTEALAVAGVEPDLIRSTFGAQASQPEFLNALGCALSHLRAARRALDDRAFPALVLEEDAVSDLQPLWPMTLASLVPRLPANWEAVYTTAPTRSLPNLPSRVSLAVVCWLSCGARFSWRCWRSRTSGMSFVRAGAPPIACGEGYHLCDGRTTGRRQRTRAANVPHPHPLCVLIARVACIAGTCCIREGPAAWCGRMG